MREQDWEPPTHDRLREHTSDHVLRRLDDRTQDALDRVGDSEPAIRARLADLDREWDVDRTVLLSSAIVGTISAGMTMRSLLRHGRIGGWGAFFWMQMSFLAHHAIRGWCPPMPVFRRLGLRSQQEICAEREALHRRLDKLTPQL